tara:strand:+ start:62 stop:289 length:228 start_codon:yes stop_codon:yes gene_type:complete
MELPIDHKDLKTIVSALSLGGDTRLYFLLKNVMDDNKRKGLGELDFSQDPNQQAGTVQIYAESDDYQCKHGECDI